MDNSDKMVEKVFMTLAEDIIVKKNDEEDAKGPEQGQKIDLGAAQQKPIEEKKGCC